jgi:hypothetical protein
MVRIIQHSEKYSSDEVQVAKDCFIGIFKNDSENRTLLEKCYEQVKHEFADISVDADAFQFEARERDEEQDFQAALEEIAKFEARERDEEEALQAAIALSMQDL